VSKTRSLWPREHGAYAQLGTPLLAALLLRSPTLGAIAIALAAVFAFLANEPMLVALGHRGKRMLASHGDVARRRFGAMAGGAILTGLSGVAASGPDTRVVAALAIPAVLALFVLAWRRRQHSLSGELVAAIAFPSAGAAVMTASGISLQDALVVWAAWSAGYACCVLAVHRVLARHRGARSVKEVLTIAAILALAIGCTLAVTPIGLAVLPLAASALALALHPPRATKLRAVGIALVTASIASGAMVLAFT
jgi:hypothetical protein